MARLSKNWAADVTAYDDGHAHMLMFTDALTDGIAQQFPDKFHWQRTGDEGWVKELDMNTGIDDGNSQRLNDRMGAVVPQRRAVLRSALAVGCGLLLPAILIGCDSKKDAGSTGAAPADSPNTGADAGSDSAAPIAPAKVTQASVQYQAQTKGVQKCSECTHFIAESGTCKLVEGEISPNAWCLLWVQKA